jgi:hypothetical protein
MPSSKKQLPFDNVGMQIDVVETPTLKAVESVITINGLKLRGNSIPVTLVGAFSDLAQNMELMSTISNTQMIPHDDNSQPLVKNATKTKPKTFKKVNKPRARGDGLKHARLVGSKKGTRVYGRC